MKNKFFHHTLAFGLVLLTFLLFPASGFANSRDACLRISEGALITGTKVLVIGIEGLASFSSIGTKRAYEYRCKVTRGLAASPPSSAGFGGFVLKNLIVPVIEEYKNQVEVLVVSHGDGGSSSGKAYHCAKIWMSENRPGSEGRKVILVGHSFGGYALPKLTGHLGNTPIAGVLSIDARFNDGPLRAKMRRKGNVERWENYYQTMPLRGYEVEGADVNQKLSGKGHTKIPGHPTVKAALKRLIGDPPGPKVVAMDLDGCGAIAKPGKEGEFRHQGTERDQNMRSPSGISGDVRQSGIDEAEQRSRRFRQSLERAKNMEREIAEKPLKLEDPDASSVSSGSTGARPKCPKGSECHFGYNIFTGQKEYVVRPIRDFASGRSQMGTGTLRTNASESLRGSEKNSTGGSSVVGDKVNGSAKGSGGSREISSLNGADLSDSQMNASEGEEISGEPDFAEAGNSTSSNQNLGAVEGPNFGPSNTRFVMGTGGSQSSGASLENPSKEVGKIVWKTIQASKASQQKEEESLFHRVKTKIQIKMLSHP